MGWKNLKMHFGITHIVQVNEKGICIGSGWVHDLAIIDPVTGYVSDSQTFSTFLKEKYPALLDASRQEILSLIESPDTFDVSVPVYTYEGGEILEKLCEVPEWPNVTHDGCVIYENTFSTDKATIVKRAKQSASLHVELDLENIARVEKDLARLLEQLAVDQANLAKLELAYPSKQNAI